MGPWHEWRREKVSRAAAAEKTVGRVSEDIARLERFVARFRYKKTKAKQAQAKLTQIGRLEEERSQAARLELLTCKRRALGFDFIRPPRTGRIVVEAENVSLAAGGKPLLESVTLVVERGEKVGLVGPNGSGKTTLLPRPRPALPRSTAARRGSDTASCRGTSRSTRRSCPPRAPSSTAPPPRPG